VAWDTGLRWGDLVGLKVDEIDDVGLGTVTQAKTGRPVSVKLSAGTLSALRHPWPPAPGSWYARGQLHRTHSVNVLKLNRFTIEIHNACDATHG